MPGTVNPPRGGILRDIHNRYETVREALSRIDKAAQENGLPDISPRLIEDGAASRQHSPEVQYLEIFAVSIAVHHLLLAEGASPMALVGQSIGELWALAAAEHLSVEDAARLAVARSQVLTRQAWNGKMLAVAVDGRRAESLAGLIAHPHLAVACENAPRQSVLSGPLPLIERVERVADSLGWPNARVEVPHPTHTPAMAQSAYDLRATAPRVPYGAGRWRVCSPWLGRDIGAEDPVVLVADALTARVRMLHTIRELYAAGADAFVECGEYPVVTKLVEAAVPGARCVVPLNEPDPAGAIRSLIADAAEIRSFGMRFSTGRHEGSSNGNGAHAEVSGAVSPVSAIPAPAAEPVSPTPVAPPAPVFRPVLVPAAPQTPAATAATATEIAAPTERAPATEPAAGAADTAGSDYETVLAELRTLYGDFLGYPPDLLGEDDGLESELGVESLKQVALLARVADQFGLPDLRANSSLITGGTLGRIAGAVVQARAGAVGR
ncbi:acyltransferase domain-containing protein [Mangrovihabitans endophyticus]|nr:acyltransferase domain-containing protein [Mangrovihabitans endophyticus]